MKNLTRIIVGVTGASGAIYAKRCLEALAHENVETHLVMSKAAEITLKYELDLSASDFESLATKKYKIGDIGAAPASGSFKTDGMIIVPCSVKSMSEIATGITSNLLTRSADVMLKEKRPLVLLVRETPFHLGHLRTMTSLAEMGATIAPPLPAFYAEPKSVADLVDQSVGRALDHLGVDSDLTKRWGDDLEKGAR